MKNSRKRFHKYVYSLPQHKIVLNDFLKRIKLDDIMDRKGVIRIEIAKKTND